MKHITKSISLALALIMLISVFAVSPITASAETSGDYDYELLDDGTAKITGYLGTDTELKIPSVINGYTVTRIGYNSFRNCEILTSIEIPETVTDIDDCAFFWCTNLTNVTFYESKLNIGTSAFYHCINLKSVTLPKNILGIFEQTFGYFYDEPTDDIAKIDGFTIYGYSNTVAETYANDNGFIFVDLENNPTYESTTATEPSETTTSTESTTSIEPSESTTPSESVTTEPTTATEHSETTTPTNPITAPTPKLKNSSVSLKAGKTSTITVQNKGNNKVTYKSSNKKVATVKNGKVTALKKGTANITVTVGKTKLIFKVNITSNPKLNKTSKKLKVKGKFTIKVSGKAGTTTFKSNKPKIATVTKKGVVKAKKKGTAQIAVTTNGGVKLKCKITVK